MTKVKIGLIQASNDLHGDEPVEAHKRLAIEKHIGLVRQAAAQGRADHLLAGNILWSLFLLGADRRNGTTASEEIPNGPTTRLFQELAKELGVVIILPIYEREGIATYYNTAAVIDADGAYLGQIPQASHSACGGRRRLLRVLGEVLF